MHSASITRLLQLFLGGLIVLLIAAIWALVEHGTPDSTARRAGVASASPIEKPSKPPGPSPTPRPVEWVEQIGRMRDEGRNQDVLQVIGLLEGNQPSLLAANDLYAVAGDAARELEQYDKALAYYRLALKPGSPVALVVRQREVQVLAQLGRPREAQAASAGLGIEADLLVAGAWKKAGELAQAESLYRKAANATGVAQSTRELARLELARVLLAQGRTREASSELKPLSASRRQTSTAGEALELLRSIEANNPQMSASITASEHLKRGQRLYEIGHSSSAVAELEAAVAKSRSRVQSTEARFLLGRVEYRREDYEEAVRRYLQAVAADSQPAYQQECLMQAARCLQILGRFDEAAAMHRRVRSLDPRTEDAAWANYELAAHLERLEKFEEAAAAHEQLGNSKSTGTVVSSALLQATRIRAALGQSSAAIANAQKLLTTQPRSRHAPEARLLMARELGRSGRIAEANSTYQRILDEYSGTLYGILAERGLAESTGRSSRPSGRGLSLRQLPRVASPSAPHLLDLFADLRQVTGWALRAGQPGLMPAPVFQSIEERDAWLLTEGASELPRARLHLRLRQYDAAAESIAAMLKQTPRDRDLLWTMIQVSHQAGRPHRSLDYAERLGRLYGNSDPLVLPKALLAELYPRPYPNFVEQFAQRSGVDPFLALAVIRQESRFNPEARSLAAARGLMQIVPITFERLRTSQRRPELALEDLMRPEVNLDLGIAYLRQLSEEFKGRPEAILSAYNAGPGNAQRWLSHSRGQDLLDYMASITFKETRDYVRIVLYNWWVYHALYRNDRDQLLLTSTPSEATGD